MCVCCGESTERTRGPKTGPTTERRTQSGAAQQPQTSRAGLGRQRSNRPPPPPELRPTGRPWRTGGSRVREAYLRSFPRPPAASAFGRSERRGPPGRLPRRPRALAPPPAAADQSEPPEEVRAQRPGQSRGARLRRRRRHQPIGKGSPPLPGSERTRRGGARRHVKHAVRLYPEAQLAEPPPPPLVPSRFPSRPGPSGGGGAAPHQTVEKAFDCTPHEQHHGF